MADDILELTVEKPVAGGRMLARHEGRIVLVAGAIPGERVRARVERRVKQTLFAAVSEVLEASPHRREPFCNPRCGGLTYAHVAIAYQPVLKADVVSDAFRRIAGVTVAPPIVWPSPEEGYRLRARLHLQGGQAGFLLEGSHSLCDAAATRQLRDAVLPAVEALLSALGPARSLCDAVTVSENVNGSECVCHLELREGARLGHVDVVLPAGVTGVTAQTGRRVSVVAGQPTITERASGLFPRGSPIAPSTQWTRSAAAFFQGNRFLTGDLVALVLSQAQGGRAIDAYAGVGLFAVALAARGLAVTAVEGDAISGEDLESNASSSVTGFQVVRASVEEALPTMGPGTVDTLVLDPPRTGASPEALTAVVRLNAPRLVYVSCDPATLARDAKGLLGAGYRLKSVTGFDLFPNTPHIESVAVFDR
ncbi:MAG: TRAM domain-containing protein [Acidobacteriota bacterium]